MSNQSGFIKMPRNLYADYFQHKPPLYYTVWTNLVSNAQYKPYKNLNRGQLYTSIPKLQQECTYYEGLKKVEPTKDQIFNILEYLRGKKRSKHCNSPVRQENDALYDTIEPLITTTKATHGLLVTICNFNDYQGSDSCRNDTLYDKETTHYTTQETERANNINKERNNNERIKKENILLGEFQNVKLTNAELDQLKEKFPYNWQEWIERLSLYIKSKGDNYKSHYATILNWAKKETIQDLSPQAKQKRSEALRKQREAEQKAEDERETEEWYKEKMKQYGVSTRAELDEILKEQQRVAKERLKNIGALFN